MTAGNPELVAATESMIDRVGVDTATPAVGQDTALWAALTEAGFTAIGIPESQDGSGGTLADALAVVSAAVTGGALTMLVEHTVLAGWLAARCGVSLGSRTATVALAGRECAVRETADGFVLDGSVAGVVHGADADLLVVLLDRSSGDGGPAVAIVAPSAPGATVSRGTDLVGAAVDDYLFEATPLEFCAELSFATAEFEQRAALAYATALTAAARAVRDRTLRYASERKQFGRALSEFQAIQQRLAGLAGLTAMMETATEAAVAEDATGDSPRRTRTAIAAAKVVTSSSAREIAAAGHQIHGAIGFTSEHSLGRFTTALWAWRGRYGSERRWADVLAGQILDEGVDVWDLVVGYDQDHGMAAEENHR